MKTNKGPQAWLSRDECAALRGLALIWERNRRQRRQ